MVLTVGVTNNVIQQPKSRLLKNCDSILNDPVETASLAMLVETEGHVRYYKSHPERHYEVNRWEPTVRIHMADEALVRWASTVMGGTHVTFDRSVGAWYTEARGSRALRVLACVRPFVRGEKALMVNCVVQVGRYVVSKERPCVDCESGFIRNERIEGLKRRGLL